MTVFQLERESVRQKNNLIESHAPAKTADLCPALAEMSAFRSGHSIMLHFKALAVVKRASLLAPHMSAFDPKRTRCALSHRLLHPGRRPASVQNLGFRPVETHVHCKRTTCGCR